MLEFMICSMLTIFPDYLYRRYVQGKRIGKEINLFSMWYELRWGIVACLILTLSLVTTVFYFHPATEKATAVYRTVTVLPQRQGRVAEIYVSGNDQVKEGQPLFKLDDSELLATVETARRRVAEVEAATAVTRTELDSADGLIAQAQGGYQQAVDEYNTLNDLYHRNPDVVATRDIQKRQVAVSTQLGALNAAKANKATLQSKINTQLPAQKASAEAEMQRAQVEVDKSVVRAGTDGTLQQFSLRPGDIVTPQMRAAGLLVPKERRIGLLAGFGQIESQVMRKGMIAEAACVGRPFAIIPMVVTEVQQVIAAGAIRPTDQLVDVSQINSNGTVTAYLEPLFVNQSFDDIPPGSSCLVNAYTSNHDELAHGDLSTPKYISLHVVDTLALVHALLLRLQALLLPVQTLVLSGGH